MESQELDHVTVESTTFATKWGFTLSQELEQIIIAACESDYCSAVRRLGFAGFKPNDEIENQLLNVFGASPR
jgi:hypothetical protein